MPRATPFVRWLVQALIVGLIALHLPLDALRSPAPAKDLTSKVRRCATCCASTATQVSPQPCPGPALDAPEPPAPQDGCDPGCHCGCCGGVPLVAEVRPTVALETPSQPSITFALSTAARARRLEIFHPPRA